MDKLLDAVTDLVTLVSPDKVRSIASRIRQSDHTKSNRDLANIVGNPLASLTVERLLNAWQETEISPDEMASMLLAAGHAVNRNAAKQKSELVWTGPITPFVSTRRTEQALLQVINAAKSTLFITSFVAYDVSSIVAGLNAAIDRGVQISMVLELSQDEGGSISIDVLAKMRVLVSKAKFYAWKDKDSAFMGGKVHSKVAVADKRICFITSANLTGYAMERNMEAGILLTGGEIPMQLHEHLRALVDTKVISVV